MCTWFCCGAVWLNHWQVFNKLIYSIIISKTIINNVKHPKNFEKISIWIHGTVAKYSWYNYQSPKHVICHRISLVSWYPGIILCMHAANEGWRYTVTPSLLGWAHTQNDPWIYNSEVSIVLILYPIVHCALGIKINEVHDNVITKWFMED